MRHAGRLQYFVSAWKELPCGPKELMSVTGYEIPFIRTPFQTQIPENGFFTASQVSEMDKAIQKLISLGSIVETVHTQGEFVSKIFLVPKPDGTSRFILNLKKLNKFVKNEHFKMEDYRTVQKLMTRSCYFASIDLKEAYNLIPISIKHRKFLRFMWKGKLYEFTCLPFGLSSGPRVFTKLLKLVIAVLRTNGVVLVIYLDDMLVFGSCREACESAVSYCLQLLQSLGFVINFKKSQLIPSQQIRYLGFVFDSVNMSVSLPEDKRKKSNQTL